MRTRPRRPAIETEPWMPQSQRAWAISARGDQRCAVRSIVRDDLATPWFLLTVLLHYFQLAPTLTWTKHPCLARADLTLFR